MSAALGRREDATDLPLVTIDPPGAKDLDQAMLLRRRGSGYRVDYAIADPGHFIRPGGALDTEARRRGQTLYLPDELVPLHPPQLSEDAASLLPEESRPAVLWTIDCDSGGAPERVHVRRALVRSVAQFDYDTVRDRLTAGTPHPSYALLPELGRLRRNSRSAGEQSSCNCPTTGRGGGDGGWKLCCAPRWTSRRGTRNLPAHRMSRPS